MFLILYDCRQIVGYFLGRLAVGIRKVGALPVEGVVVQTFTRTPLAIGTLAIPGGKGSYKLNRVVGSIHRKILLISVYFNSHKALGILSQNPLRQNGLARILALHPPKSKREWLKKTITGIGVIFTVSGLIPMWLHTLAGLLASSIQQQWLGLTRQRVFLGNPVKMHVLLLIT